MQIEAKEDMNTATFKEDNDNKFVGTRCHQMIELGAFWKSFRYPKWPFLASDKPPIRYEINKNLLQISHCTDGKLFAKTTVLKFLKSGTNSLRMNKVMKQG